MALTTAQTITLFQILDTPYSTSFTTMDGMGATGITAQISAATAGQAKSMIIAYLATIDANTETELTKLLTSWGSISTNTVKIESGSLGSLSGIWFNYDAQRKSIEDRIRIIVPFYKQAEVLRRYAEQDASFNVQVVR